MVMKPNKASPLTQAVCRDGGRGEEHLLVLVCTDEN